MIWSRSIVAGRLGRVIADEDGAGVVDEGYIFRVNGNVFRSNAVCPDEPLFSRLSQQYRTIALCGLSSDRILVCKFPDSRADPAGQQRRSGNESWHGGRIMFGLRHQIGRNKIGAAAID